MTLPRHPSPPPPGFSAEAFFAGTHWHQRWELFQGVFTPGSHSVEQLCARVRLPPDLSGMRVLDIGAWNGCFSFECERRGASEVVASSLENPNASGFNKLKQLLGSRVSYVQESVYFLSPDVVGTFDLVLFFGVLYHLRYPLLAVDRIRTLSRGAVLIETHIVTDDLLLRKPFTILARLLMLSRLFRSTPIWRQYRAYEAHPEDPSNWFGPNVQAVIEAFESAAFDVTHLGSWGRRATFRAQVNPERSKQQLRGAYESVFSANARLAGVPYRRTHRYRDEAD